MTHLASYSVLRYFPYKNRGEHVYIGIMVLLPDGSVRVHVSPNLRKVKGIDPAADIDGIRNTEATIPEFIKKMGWSGESIFQNLQDWGRVVPHSNVSQFIFNLPEEYDQRVQSILDSLVVPRRSSSIQREPISRLFMDVKKVFYTYDWLGKFSDDINKHLIVPRYPVSERDGLKAEFALRNGSLHIIETVDFRADNFGAKRQEAMSKALVFDLAAKIEGKSVCSYVVTAGSHSSQAKPITNLLSHYTTNILSWESPEDMNFLIKAMEVATGKPRPPELPLQ
ncbi:DUF3037 domain-containing protein [Acidithiobacillus sp.]|uniref:DUF3037 domain-containing protein n=1 Tax=Acidithiobacillus sp. TaxID=1872118 RepID=UPI00262D0EA1|nr:DUF3037 domain-containing protein [Acidithiobacillus sp.]MDD2749815.1 DUF3037 domain-containing protein [Acidithiobacillus sp.]MDD5280669.1 DUF3037 domain-containing protein [Acidithiobacillus sp.]